MINIKVENPFGRRGGAEEDDQEEEDMSVQRRVDLYSRIWEENIGLAQTHAHVIIMDMVSQKLNYKTSPK